MQIGTNMTTNIKMLNELVALRDELFKRNPHYSFVPKEREGYGDDKNRNYFEVYMTNEPDIRIGAIGYISNEKKWWVSSCFKQGGRWINSAPESGKTSIHMKSIVKQAPQMLCFPTMQEFMQSNYLWAMGQHIRQKQQQLNWDMSHNTHSIPEGMYADFLKLKDMGYKPLSLEVKEVMDYLELNYEKYQQAKDYNPTYYHVWFKRSDITYQKYQGDEVLDESKTVATRAELPQTIIEKLAILDLLEVNNEVHDDLGVRGKPNFYSVFE
jgi:hypothetical protein